VISLIELDKVNKDLLERATILDGIKNVCDLWEEVKMSTLPGILRMSILILMDGFEGPKTSV
jgi:hypothetical protein